jgi:hypothetical protein
MSVALGKFFEDLSLLLDEDITKGSEGGDSSSNININRSCNTRVRINIISDNAKLTTTCTEFYGPQRGIVRHRSSDCGVNRLTQTSRWEPSIHQNNNNNNNNLHQKESCMNRWETLPGTSGPKRPHRKRWSVPSTKSESDHDDKKKTTVYCKGSTKKYPDEFVGAASLPKSLRSLPY